MEECIYEYVGPQIRLLMKNKTFDEKLNHDEVCACTPLEAVATDFLVDPRVKNSEILMKDLLIVYKKCVA